MAAIRACNSLTKKWCCMPGDTSLTTRTSCALNRGERVPSRRRLDALPTPVDKLEQKNATTRSWQPHDELSPHEGVGMRCDRSHTDHDECLVIDLDARALDRSPSRPEVSRARCLRDSLHHAIADDALGRRS